MLIVFYNRFKIYKNPDENLKLPMECKNPDKKSGNRKSKIFVKCDQQKESGILAKKSIGYP
jgi:hypothetical protein